MARVPVEPTLLRWARQRSGRDAASLQKRFPRLAAWERGDTWPTLKQLGDFATFTRTPFGYFFLQEPPGEDLPIADFRTIRNDEVARPSPDLLDTLYRCQQRQDWYRDEARGAGEPPLDFIGSLNVTTSVVSAAAELRRVLDFDIERRRQAATWTEALRHFIEQADSLGILIMVSGVVGNNTHRILDPEEFRGFTLADPLAPLIFINGADTKSAQMFTLAHELAHLWIGESGLSNAVMTDVSGPSVMPDAPRHSVEAWCNEVAAQLLVPTSVIHEEFDRTKNITDELKRLARRFKVSTLVVLRSIFDAGFLDENEFWSAYDEELARIKEIAAPTGGNYYRNVGARASKRFSRALLTSTLEGRTTIAEAMHLLDVKKASAILKLAEGLGVVV